MTWGNCSRGNDLFRKENYEFPPLQLEAISSLVSAVQLFLLVRICLYTISHTLLRFGFFWATLFHAYLLTCPFLVFRFHVADSDVGAWRPRDSRDGDCEGGVRDRPGESPGRVLQNEEYLPWGRRQKHNWLGSVARHQGCQWVSPRSAHAWLQIPWIWPAKF